MSEEFFHGEKSAIEVKVCVLTDGKQGDIIYQYIAFTKIYNEQVKIYERKEAIKETIRICKNRNILKKFISKHEAEIINIMTTLFDEKNVMKAFVKEKREEGIEIGRQEGIELGVNKRNQEIAEKLKIMGYSDEEIAAVLD